MAASVFTHALSVPSIPIKAKPKPIRTATGVSAQALITSPQASFSDPFVLQLAESLEDSLSSSPSPSEASPLALPLQRIRDNAAQKLLSTPWPSRKDEPFRFTDISFIKQSQILPVSCPPQFSTSLDDLNDTQSLTVTIVDGFIENSASNLKEVPDGVYVGSLSSASDYIVKKVSELMGEFQWGDLFWSINGMGAPDCTVVYVPVGCKLENPIHFRYFSIEGDDVGSNKLPLSNPRVFVLVEKEGAIGIIEEFVGKETNPSHWTNSILEVVIREGGKVNHSYLQTQSLNAAHTKWTSVQQESGSTYELVEISTGSKLGRHNLHVQQLGPETSTELMSFHLSVGDQTQDLHSRIILDHPQGYSQQLHKCIVAHSLGQAVFDGNVKVNKYAQQTNAGQLTRSLLLEPRATVNIKPNLQIIADDVKCSHGAAISDLEESQLFYFQARGIDLKTARKALIFSFGAEVIERLPNSYVREQVRNHVKELLESTPKGES